MKETNTAFDTLHALNYRRPVYLVQFDGESIDYSSGAVGESTNTIKKYITEIRGASQRVTPEEGRASIGGISFNLLDFNDEITALIATDTYYFHRKKVTVLAGYQGMDESDFLTIMVGWITGMKLSSNGLSYAFDVTDPLKWMQRKIFRGAEDSSVTLSGNPINIMLQVLTSTGAGTNGDYDTLAAADALGIDEDFINMTNIEAVRDDWFPGPSVQMSFTIEKRIQAKKWFEKEIWKMLNVYPVIDGDGKFNIKPFKPPLPSSVAVQTLDTSNIIGLPALDFNLSELINEIECFYDWDSVDDEFDSELFYIESTSLNNRGPGKKPLKLESKGMTAALGASDFFAKRKNRVFARYATPPPKITVSTLFDNWLTEAGDIVPLTHPNLPDIEAGTRGLTSERMEVVNRTIGWKRGRVKIELLATAFEKGIYCQISPKMVVTAGDSTTQFQVSAADAAKFEVGQIIDIFDVGMRAQATDLEITDISVGGIPDEILDTDGDAIEDTDGDAILDTAGGSTYITVGSSIGATPATGWICTFSSYDNCTTDQKLYWFLSDSGGKLGAADDDAHLITP